MSISFSTGLLMEKDNEAGARDVLCAQYRLTYVVAKFATRLTGDGLALAMADMEPFILLVVGDLDEVALRRCAVLLARVRPALPQIQLFELLVACATVAVRAGTFEGPLRSVYECAYAMHSPSYGSYSSFMLVCGMVKYDPRCEGAEAARVESDLVTEVAAHAARDAPLKLPSPADAMLKFDFLD